MNSSYEETLLAGTAILSGVLMVIAVISFIIGIIVLISMIKIFKKAGKPGWAAIIPIYNLMVMIDLVGLPGVYVLLMFIPIVNIYAYIKMSAELAKKFGKSSAFTIVLILLPYIGFPVLAFSSCTYNGGKSGSLEVSSSAAPEAETTDPVPDVVASPELSAAPLNQSLNIETQSLTEVEAATEPTEEALPEAPEAEAEASVQSAPSISDEAAPAPEEPAPVENPVVEPTPEPPSVPAEPTPIETPTEETPVENKDNI